MEAERTRDPVSGRRTQRGRASASAGSGLLGSLRRTWYVLLALIVALVLIGGFSYDVIVGRMEAQLESQLKTLLRADVEAVRLWIVQQELSVEREATAPEILLPILRILRRLPDGDETHHELRERLDAVVVRHGFESWALIDAQGRVVGASGVRSVGGSPLRGSRFVETLLGGDVAVSHPILLPPSREAAGDVEAPAMFVGAPVRDEGGNIVGFLAVRVNPARDFTRILNLARMGTSGETYAFDRGGRLLSDSRFEDQLREVGLLEAGVADSSLRVEARDPGVNLLRGQAPARPRELQPLLRSVEGAVELARTRAARIEVDVDGYRDYRGVKVIGAFTWLPELDAGVTTQVDHEEAFRTLTTLLRGFWSLFGLLALAATGLFLYIATVDRLRRKVEAVERLGQYRLDKKIGAGGMGTVYRATHALLKRPTAVKLLDHGASERDMERFEREVQVTARMTHPNTVAVYDFGHTPAGIFYYAMEYLVGITLAELVRDDGPQPEARVVSILQQLLGSLAEAHDAGLVHRDVKPANVMITSRGGYFDFVKVLDFGLVREIEGEDSGGVSGQQTLTGTPLYMSPEAIGDPDAVDAQSDLYQVGCVAYYLLTASHVFEGKSVVEICRHHLETPPTLPSERASRILEPALEALVISCLAKSKSERPASARAMLELLSASPLSGRWHQHDARGWWESWSSRARSSQRSEESHHPPTLVVDIEERLRVSEA